MDLSAKTSRSLFSPLERRLDRIVLPRIPRWLETYHLTWLTLLWCGLIVLFSARARDDIRWLWMVSAAIALHYLTDHFDGKVGKLRGTGLVQWGYYMDHLFDYVFLCALIIGYALLLPERSAFDCLLVLASFSGLLVHTFLRVATMHEFAISLGWFGPTEFRIALIIINAVIVRAGTHQMQRVLPWVAAGGAVALAIEVWRTQRALWRLDMEAKERQNL